MYSLRLSNDDGRDITLRIEPWATEVTLVKGRKYDLLLTDDGSHPPDPELVLSADQRVLTFYGWSGTSFALLENGQPLYDFLPP